MIEYGIVAEYDGYSGTIITQNNTEYLLLKKEILYDNPSKGDAVTFLKETVTTFTETKNVARFVKKRK